MTNIIRHGIIRKARKSHKCDTNNEKEMEC